MRPLACDLSSGVGANNALLDHIQAATTLAQAGHHAEAVIHLWLCCIRTSRWRSGGLPAVPGEVTGLQPRLLHRDAALQGTDASLRDTV